MNVISLLDDCPRSHKILNPRYCVDTKCLYFKGIVDKFSRDCSHPDAGTTPIELINYREDMLEKFFLAKPTKEP